MLALVLGTYDLTGITAVESVANLLHELLFQKTLCLRQERNAALCIQLPWSDQCPRWTGIDALRAFSASLSYGLVRLEGNVCHQLPQVYP
ncbi:hypothetical protein D3C78_1847110 [compost metagenome]